MFGKICGHIERGSDKFGRASSTYKYLGTRRDRYHIFIGLPILIQLRARTDYYRMVLKIHYGGDSEILNYEYGRDNGNTSEDEFTSENADED